MAVHRSETKKKAIRGCTVKSSTTVVLAAALCRAVANASRRSFLFILMLQSLGCAHAGASGRIGYSCQTAAVCPCLTHRVKRYAETNVRQSSPGDLL